MSRARVTEIVSSWSTDGPLDIQVVGSPLRLELSRRTDGPSLHLGSRWRAQVFLSLEDAIHMRDVLDDAIARERAAFVALAQPDITPPIDYPPAPDAEPKEE